MRKLAAAVTATIVVSSLAGLTHAVAGGLIVPISQDRRVSTMSHAWWLEQEVLQEDAHAAPDFGPFDKLVSNGVSLGGLGTWGFARQISSIGDQTIDVSGEVSFDASTFDPEALAHVRATSTLDVSFTLAHEATYVFQGLIDGDNFGRAQLSGPDGIVQDHQLLMQPVGFRDTGTLPAGQYRLWVFGDVEALAVYPQYCCINLATSYTVALTFDASSFGASGQVPNGDDVPGLPLRLRKVGGEQLRLRWDPSCHPTASDFAIYEGVIGDFENSIPVTCSTSGLLSYHYTPTSPSAWFLVVPHDGQTEGSYGQASGGIERSPSLLACRSQELGFPICPPR